MVTVPVRYDDWYFHPSDDATIDVAVAPYSLKRTQIVFAAVPIDSGITYEILNSRSIGVGEEVFVTGLFRNHRGHELNVPIVRVGTIAGMPEEKVWTSMGYMDAYLVEAMSIGGLSGSPVFVHLSPLRVIEGVVTPTTGPQYYLLGLMHGHFDVRNLNDDVVTDDEALENINTGIGVVVPATKISAIIMSPELVRLREEAIQELRKESGVTPDIDLDDELEPPT